MLEAKKLTKSYGDHLALNNLDLSVERGEIFALLGQNGAGKTTTINLFLGFLKPTSGGAFVNGISVAEHPGEVKKHLAYLPETVLLYPNLTGRENLEYFSALAGFEYTKEKLGDLLSAAGLQQKAFDVRLEGYSKGMRQKVGIAIAMAKQAKVLLLDEPTSGLDPKASNDFSELITTLSKNGTAILMATHDIFRAKEVATHIGIMKQGVLQAVVKAADISANELESLYLRTV